MSPLEHNKIVRHVYIIGVNISKPNLECEFSSASSGFLFLFYIINSTIAKTPNIKSTMKYK